MFIDNNLKTVVLSDKNLEKSFLNNLYGFLKLKVKPRIYNKFIYTRYCGDNGEYENNNFRDAFFALIMFGVLETFVLLFTLSVKEYMIIGIIAFIVLLFPIFVEIQNLLKSHTDMINDFSLRKLLQKHEYQKDNKWIEEIFKYNFDKNVKTNFKKELEFYINNTNLSDKDYETLWLKFINILMESEIEKNKTLNKLKVKKILTNYDE